MVLHVIESGMTHAAVEVSHENDELSVADGIQACKESAEESRVSIGIVHRDLSGDSELSAIRALVRNIQVVTEASKPVICVGERMIV